MSIQELNERICEHCNAPIVEHDYQQLARECYPQQIERLEAEAERRLDTNGRMRVELANAQSEIKQLRHMYEAAHVDANAAIERQQVEIDRLRAENAQLVATMKRAVNAAEVGSIAWMPAIDEARAAVAKAEGTK